MGVVFGGVRIRLRTIESQRRRLEEQVVDRTRQLSEAMAQLEQSKLAAEAASRAKSAFLANMSHEFRTPLNAILGFTQMMRRSADMPPDQNENVEIIQRSSEHLLGLINEVLEMSKIEAGRSTLNLTPFELPRMISGLQEMFQLRAEQKGLDLTLEPGSGLPDLIRADEGKLRQVLMNLLGNAVKFSHSGVVTLRVQQAGQSFGTDRTVLRFEVQDTGPGILPEDMDRIFVPFVQSTAGEQSQEGTGLGLTISQQYVRLMGGEIKVSSQPGLGSTFSFEIPVAVAADLELERPETALRVVGLEQGQPVYRMLVVDDQEVNRRLLVKTFTPLGFEVREASNGKEALAAWETWAPHLIWMDMRMPVMDGFEATRRIKAAIQGQSTVVVALTASSLEEDKDVILSAGCDDYLRKPFFEQDIFEIVARHLGVRYIYDKPEPGLSASVGQVPLDLAQQTTRSLSNADPGWLSQLEQAALLGDVKAIHELADVLAPAESDLAETIRKLADRFDHDTLLSLLRRGHKEG
jgi:signal transduction histidine kinase/DNA-binding response OmpR family regulator